MDLLQIKLFDKFELKYAGVTLPEPGSNRARELLCYILLHGTRSYPREALSELLWGDDSKTLSKKFMRQTVWEIQSMLKVYAGMDDLRLLLVSSNRIQLNPELPYEMDVAEFERVFNMAQGIPVSEISSRQIETLQKAEALYCGDLLEGYYWDWCVAERERYKDMYLVILEKLMIHFEISRQYEIGLAYGNRILNFDRALESAHQHIMRLYYLAGDRVKALRQFERCAIVLKQELGVNPSQQTQWLYQQIKAEQLDEPTPLSARVPIGLFPKLQDNLIHSLNNRANSENSAII